jgi:hypothetical protein
VKGIVNKVQDVGTNLAVVGAKSSTSKKSESIENKLVYDPTTGRYLLNGQMMAPEEDPNEKIEQEKKLQEVQQAPPPVLVSKGPVAKLTANDRRMRSKFVAFNK